MQPTNITERLRSETAILHQQLEDLPISRSILKPDVQVDEYGAYLATMYGIMKSVETNVFPVLKNVLPDIEKREKAHLLTRDLQAINYSFNPSEWSAGEAEIHFLHIQDLESEQIAYALGVLYVVEGSTLGGRFILKNIREALQFDASNGAAYFAGYAEETGPMWKSFLHVLQQYAAEHGQEDKIIQGANEAFQAFYNTFSTTAHA